jgi:hypothetical protein
MSLSFEDGRPIAKIITGKYKGKVIFIDADENAPGAKYSKIDLRKNKVQPVLDPEIRDIAYIAGPSGSGKSTLASKLALTFKKLFPKKDIYFFSRKNWEEDPAFKKIKPIQVIIDKALVEDPIVMEDIDPGSLLIFDDVSTITNKAQKDSVYGLIKDVLEVGRARKLDMIITNHLINPNDREFARTILNELKSLTVFPKAGSAYQIRYALKNYFGLSKKQIDEILRIKSRWVTIYKTYPMTILYENGAYIL